MGAVNDDMRMEVEQLARMADRPPWIIARSLASLIEKGLVSVEDGTPEEAAASLRALALSYAAKPSYVARGKPENNA